MVCKIVFCFEFPDIPDNAERTTRRRGRRRRTQAIAKRYAFHSNATMLFLTNPENPIVVHQVEFVVILLFVNRKSR